MTERRSSPVRVLIADDHRLFAEALAGDPRQEERITVVGRAADGLEAVELARTLRPDVVALDISMPVMDGFEAAAALEKLEHPPAVLMLTGSSSRARRRPRPASGREGLRHEGRDRGEARRRDPRSGRVKRRRCYLSPRDDRRSRRLPRARLRALLRSSSCTPGVTRAWAGWASRPPRRAGRTSSSGT